MEPDYILKDGDRVQIIRRKEPVLFDPELQTLCQTPRARSYLSKGFRVRRQTLAEEIGQSILLQEMKAYDVPFDVLEKKKAVAVFNRHDAESLEEIYQLVGLGKIHLRELIQDVIAEVYPGHKNKKPLTNTLNMIFLSTLDPVCIKFSGCCKPAPTDKKLLGLLDERGISVHQNECNRLQNLKVEREEVVELRWKLKETVVSKPQTLFIEEAKRNRIMMLLSVAPQSMKIDEVISLSRIITKTPAWEINFHVANLYDLKKILQHFAKSGLPYEFSVEQ